MSDEHDVEVLAGGPLRRDAERRVLPRMPEVLNDHRLRRVRPDPSLPVSASYADQEYRVTDEDGRDHLLQPVPETPLERECDLPVELPVHLVSGWHPQGRPSDYGDCQGGHDTLHNALLAVGGYPIRQAVAMPSDSSWFEEQLMVGELTDEQAVAVGREHGQAAVVRWDRDALVVLPTGLRDDIVATRSPWRLTPVGKTCPMRRDDDPVARCREYGGPYGSRAIHAAALWQAHRAVAVGLLGCAPCRNGTGPIDGPWGRSRGGISLSDEVLGSRYGGYTWQP